MKKLVLITLAVLIAGVTAFAASEPGFVSLRNINKIETGTQVIGRALNQTGPIVITSAAACNVFLNATTLSGTTQTNGYPMLANTEYRYNVPQTTDLAFTCATSAAKKYVYIVR